MLELVIPTAPCISVTVTQELQVVFDGIVCLSLQDTADANPFSVVRLAGLRIPYSEVVR
jgi:hypothetical protein